MSLPKFIFNMYHGIVINECHTMTQPGAVPYSASEETKTFSSFSTAGKTNKDKVMKRSMSEVESRAEPE